MPHSALCELASEAMARETRVARSKAARNGVQRQYPKTIIANTRDGPRKCGKGVRMSRKERGACAASIDRNHARQDGERGRSALEENIATRPAENVVETQRTTNMAEKAYEAEKTKAGKPAQADEVEDVDLCTPPGRRCLSSAHALTVLTKTSAESGVKKPKTPSRPLVRSVPVHPRGVTKRENRRAAMLARERTRVKLNRARILSQRHD